MERLTERHYLPECGFYMKCTEHCNSEDIDCVDCAALENLVDRLGNYEDTGLMPEEVAELQRDWSDLCTVVGECGGLDRLRELAEAALKETSHET